jgi:predicted nucleic acid-binding protein
MSSIQLPPGARVFVDANTLVFHFAQHPKFGAACTEFMERIGRGELSGFASADVLSDLAHRMMTIEAMQLFGWPAAGISQRLRRHAAEIQRLTLFRRAVDGAHQSGLHLLPVTPQQVSAATAISQQFGLLSGDALIVAVMREHGLVHLASYDSDFDRVAGLTRYAPA